MKCCIFSWQEYQHGSNEMLITKLALPGRNIMCTQFVQFSCCAEPHNCAFCCNLSLVDLFTRDPVLPSSAHCCSLASVAALDVKTSNSSIEWPRNEIVEQDESKYACWLRIRRRKIIIMPSKTFSKLLSWCCLPAREELSGAREWKTK